MILFMRFFATFVILLALACSTPAQQQATAPAVPNGSDVAARVGTRAITVKELDDRWRADSPTEQAQAVQQLYDGRKQALDAIVADMLIEQAAKAKGQTLAQYRDAEVARRLTPVTDGQIAAFYAQNQAQMQGRPLPQMTEPIRQYLEEQQRATAFQAMVAELRKAGPAVSVVLDRAALHRQRRRGRSGPRRANAAGDAGRVLRLPVPVLRARDADAEEGEGSLRRPGAHRLEGFPADVHSSAGVPAPPRPAQCAREQGKFWELHDVLFANQQALQPDDLKKHAAGDRPRSRRSSMPALTRRSMASACSSR